MLPRPDACRGCPLDSHPRTRGFVRPDGPTSAPLLYLGEGAGDEEARTGLPFQGAAGGMLNRLFTRNHWDRRAVRVANVISCQPPNNWFDERAPWYWGARQHCAVHRDPVLAEGHKVVVALGGTALKTLLGVDKGIRVEDWHACVTPDPRGFLIVPTFHPSHLQRGAHNLFGCVSFDLQRAHQVAREGWAPDTPSIIEDPPVDWFTMWVAQVVAAARQDPESVWLTVDIETPDKSEGQDEGELSYDDRSYTILRVNFSVHPDEGVTVPYAGPYVALIDRLLRLPVLTGWNIEYDRPRLEAAGHVIPGDWLDGMWLWHFLQSDLPRGLGFAAPFFSRFGAWKHTAKGRPAYYAACDGFQNYRTVDGVARALQAAGQWDVALRHTHRLHKVALRPAQQVGLLISRPRIEVFIEDLTVKQRRVLHRMQGLVPEELRPLTPKGGYKRAPEEGKVHAKGTSVKRDGTAKKEAPDPIKQELYAQTAVLVEREVDVTGYTCGICHQQDVVRTHRCDPGRERDLVLGAYRATRWFWQEPFNPDSPDQILTYMKARGHKPGRGKKTGNDSTDKDTLTRLARETKDPLYQEILDSRAIGKVRGTYGVGTLKLMDAEDRVHPVPTFRPSTMRLSYMSPNITNVVADKGDTPGKVSLASGFRKCVVAGETLPSWVTPEGLKDWEARWCTPSR